MPPSSIRKNLIKPIIHSGLENAFKYLNQPAKSQPKMDHHLFNHVVAHLKHTAAYNGLISLSAPQIAFQNRIFVILKKPLIKYSAWTGYEDLFRTQKPQDCYDAIVNPQIVGHSTFKVKGDQQCPSVDGLKFKVWVPLKNQMTFVRYSQKTEKSKVKPVFDSCQEQFTGFYGRVFDHEFRHLEGMLVSIPEVCNNELYLTEEAKENPQNFIILRNLKLQRQYFDGDHMLKDFKRQSERMKKQADQDKKKPKKESSLSSNSSPQSIPDQIDSKLKQQLTKSYEKAKGTQKLNLNPVSLKEPQIITDEKQIKKRQNSNSRKQVTKRSKTSLKN